MSCTYIIKSTADITQAMIDVCQEDSLTSLRDSTDGRSWLKWQGTDPPMFSGDTKYSESEALVITKEAEWSPSM